MTQTMEKPKTREEQIALNRAFLQDVQSLYANDRGKIAVLKRGVGDTFADARGMRGRGWFYYYLSKHFGGSIDRRDNLCLLIAGLMTFDKNTMLYGLKGGGGDFGATLAFLRSPQEKDTTRPGQTPLERRLVSLLDATFDEDGGGEMAFRLRQAVKYTLSKNDKAPIDWPRLLQDMVQWNQPNKWVQKQWARSFYNVPKPEADAESETPDAAP